MAHEPDPSGVAEAPNTEPMQRMADALRGLTVGQPTRDYVIATARASADIMELQTDWLIDQHRLIMSQSKSIEKLGETIAELLDLLGKGPE